MTNEAERRSGRKKKKPRKDKWGQPLAYTVEEAEEGEETAEMEEKPVAPPVVGNQTEFEPRKVVVSGMPYWATEDEIRGLFKDVGSISQLQLSTFPDSGNFRGLAFVSFSTEELAEKSLELDGVKMGNRFIKVERCILNTQKKRKSDFSNEPQKAEGCLSAYIGNLSWDTTEDDIAEFFGTSKITSIRFAQNKRTGAFRGFGHIDFADDESLEEAVKKNQVELRGRPMKIAYAVSNRS